MTELIHLPNIKDPGAQMRVEMRAETVNDYAEAMLNDADFPPVILYHDGTDYWLGDGYHRVAAARKIEHETIKAEVREGTARDAILCGVGANATHGLQRTQADKRQAIERLLFDPEWARWSDRKKNTESDWAYLCWASLAARYLDLIPFNGLIDKRNDEPLIYAKNVDPQRKLKADCRTFNEWTRLDKPGLPMLPFLSVDGFEVIQDYIVEIWIEKSTQNDWLLPLCRRRGVNLVVGIGEQSEVRARELALRSAEYKAPVRVLYLSDFDPGGRSMPKAVARKVEFTIYKLNLNVDFQLIPLVLTPEQCRQYNLPRIPIKETERRKDTFEQNFGIGATELDALEALHPGEMARIVEEEINNWLDPNLEHRVRRVQTDQWLGCKRIEKRVHEKYAEQIKELSDRFNEFVGKLNDWEREADELWGTIAEELNELAPDLSDLEIPRSEVPGKTERFVLFDSKRDYLTQMDRYNAWRDGDEAPREAAP
jgi:hypothetical protein